MMNKMWFLFPGNSQLSGTDRLLSLYYGLGSILEKMEYMLVNPRGERSQECVLPKLVFQLHSNFLLLFLLGLSPSSIFVFLSFTASILSVNFIISSLVLPQGFKISSSFCLEMSFPSSLLCWFLLRYYFHRQALLKSIFSGHFLHFLLIQISQHFSVSEITY